jgi:hypothetical protein
VVSCLKVEALVRSTSTAHGKALLVLSLGCYILLPFLGIAWSLVLPAQGEEEDEWFVLGLFLELQ